MLDVTFSSYPTVDVPIDERRRAFIVAVCDYEHWALAEKFIKNGGFEEAEIIPFNGAA